MDMNQAANNATASLAGLGVSDLGVEFPDELEAARMRLEAKESVSSLTRTPSVRRAGAWVLPIVIDEGDTVGLKKCLRRIRQNQAAHSLYALK